MIKIPYDELGKLNFQQTIQKLANTQLRDPAAFQIKHMTKALREGFFKMRDDYKSQIEEKFAVKEDGKIIEPKDGTEAAKQNLPFHTPDDKVPDAKKALDAFNKTTLTINRKKISHEVLFKNNEWSPRELEALELIVDEPGDPA